MSGDYLVRTTNFGLPSHLHEHTDIFQTTTMFGRCKQYKSTVVLVDSSTPRGKKAVIVQHNPNTPPFVDAMSGVTVNASCNQTILVIITCPQASRALQCCRGNFMGAAGASIGITVFGEDLV